MQSHKTQIQCKQTGTSYLPPLRTLCFTCKNCSMTVHNTAWINHDNITPYSPDYYQSTEAVKLWTPKKLN